MKRVYSFLAPSGGDGEGEGTGEGPGSGEGELYLSSEQVYIRNHTGSLMVVINQEYTFEQTATSTTSLPTYGSGQLGMYNQSDGTYEYHLKDHLGNIRATTQGEKMENRKSICSVCKIVHHHNKTHRLRDNANEFTPSEKPPLNLRLKGGYLLI
jgi:hypothetical protein